MATATLRQRSLSAPPSTAKTQIPHYNTTVLILHTATWTNAGATAQPSSLFQTGGSGPTSTLNPHKPIPPPAQTPPAVSSLEAFRTPARGRVALSVTGRRPKTLNRFQTFRPHRASNRLDGSRSESGKPARHIGAIAFILGSVALAERRLLIGNYDNVKKEPDQRAVAEEMPVSE